MSVSCGLALLLMLLGCASGEALRPHEHLDRRTGATLTIAAEPWSFARQQPQLAVNARDYLTVYPLRVNVGGKLAYYLAIFEWSTVDRRMRPREPEAPGMDLLLDDRRIGLEGRGIDARDAGIASWPLQQPGRAARLRVFSIDESVLRHWSTATVVRAKIGAVATDTDAQFDTWRDGRAALVSLLRATSEPAPISRQSN